MDSTCSELGFQRSPLPLSKALPQHLPISPPSTSRPDPGLCTFEVPAPTLGQTPHRDACNASEWMREGTGTLKGSRDKWHSAPRAGHAVGVGAKVRRDRARAPSSLASRSVALPTATRGRPRPMSPSSQGLAVASCERRPKPSDAPQAAYTSMSTPPLRLRPTAPAKLHTDAPPHRASTPSSLGPAPRAAVHAGIAALHTGSLEDLAGPRALHAPLAVRALSSTPSSTSDC